MTTTDDATRDQDLKLLHDWLGNAYDSHFRKVLPPAIAAIISNALAELDSLRARPAVPPNAELDTLTTKIRELHCGCNGSFHSSGEYHHPDCAVAHAREAAAAIDTLRAERKIREDAYVIMARERNEARASDDALRETQDLLAREGFPCDVLGHPQEGITRLLDKLAEMRHERDEAREQRNECIEGLDNWRGRWLHDLRAAHARIEKLEAAMKQASEHLQCPAAEYVPAMSEAWGMLDDALAATAEERK